MGEKVFLDRGLGIPNLSRVEIGTKLDQLITAVNELITDHATAKTLQDELIADHATFKTAIDALKAFAQNQITTGTPGLAIGGTATKVQLVNNIEYTINGIGYSKTATDDLWTLTGGVLADGDTRGYYLLLDSSGTATVQATAADSSSGVGGLTWPTPTADRVVVGTLTVTTSGATFTPDTTNLSAAEVTDTYSDGLSLAGALAAVLPDPPATLTATAQATLTASSVDTRAT